MEGELEVGDREELHNLPETIMETDDGDWDWHSGSEGGEKTGLWCSESGMEGIE